LSFFLKLVGSLPSSFLKIFSWRTGEMIVVLLPLDPLPSSLCASSENTPRGAFPSQITIPFPERISGFFRVHFFLVAHMDALRRQDEGKTTSLFLIVPVPSAPTAGPIQLW